MDYSSSKSRYILTGLAIIMTITAFILVGLNALNLQNLFTSGSMAGKSYKDGYLAARTMYTKMCPNIIRGESNSVSGVVLGVRSTELVIKQDSLDTNEAVDGVSDTRTIVIAEGTEIMRFEPKSDEQFQKESAAYREAMRSREAVARPPSPSTKVTMSLSEIKAGQRVTVTSDTDLRLLETINAVSVVLQ